LSNIRVTYSGLIAFTVGIFGVFTGLIFSLMITRRLSPEEFGTWTLIGSVVSYFLISEVIISYWTTRQIARGEKIGKTSVLSSSFFSLIAIPIYAVYVLGISEQSSVDFEILMFGAFLIPVYFISQTLTGLNLGHKPQAISYSLLCFELLKIPIALLTVVIFELGVEGAILAVLCAYIAKIILQLYFAKPKLKDKFNLGVLRRWLKLSWIPFYSSLPRYIEHLDIVLYSVITGSVIGIAYYHASQTVAAIVVHSGSISQALYPKLLAEGSTEKIKDIFIYLMYFAIPLLGIAILFSKPALFALNPLYQGVSFIVILLSIKMFVYTVRGIPKSVLLGMEKVDVEANPKFSNLIKSKLFFVPTLLSIFNVAYIVIFVAILLYLSSSVIDEIELVTWWAALAVSYEIPLTIYIWLVSRKHLKFSFPYVNILKYIGATLAFSIVFLLTSDSIINYEISIYDFLPSLMAQLAICVGVYLGITFLIDKKIRILIKAILAEIARK